MDKPPTDIAATFDSYPPDARGRVLELRALILSTAAVTPGVGRVEESLKWGQPSYATPDTKSGSPIRIGVTKGGGVALYTHCQTTIMADAQMLFPHDFRFEGNRAVHFEIDAPLPRGPLTALIRAALTYHQK